MAQGYHQHLARRHQSAEASTISLHVTATPFLPPTREFFPGCSLHLRVKFKISPWPKQPCHLIVYHFLGSPQLVRPPQTASSSHHWPFAHAMPSVRVPSLSPPTGLPCRAHTENVSLRTYPSATSHLLSPLGLPVSQSTLFSPSFTADITLGDFNRPPLSNACLPLRGLWAPGGQGLHAEQSPAFQVARMSHKPQPPRLRPCPCPDTILPAFCEGQRAWFGHQPWHVCLGSDVWTSSCPVPRLGFPGIPIRPHLLF